MVHAIAWHGSGRGVRITPQGVGVFGGGAARPARRRPRSSAGSAAADQLGGLAALLVYLALVGGAWLAVSLQLPHRDVRWPPLLPGAPAVRRRAAVRQRLQRLRDDAPGRGPGQHLRRARDRRRAAVLARARRAADRRIRGAQRIAGRTPHTKPEHRFLGSDRTPCRHPTKTRRPSGAGARCQPAPSVVTIALA